MPLESLGCFIVLTGALFLYAGFTRLAQLGSAKSARDKVAIVAWASVGFAIGAICIGYLLFLVFKAP